MLLWLVETIIIIVEIWSLTSKREFRVKPNILPKKKKRTDDKDLVWTYDQFVDDWSLEKNAPILVNKAKFQSRKTLGGTNTILNFGYVVFAFTSTSTQASSTSAQASIGVKTKNLLSVYPNKQAVRNLHMTIHNKWC